jgi:hypothetical protein
MPLRPFRRGFDPALHTSIASVLTGFAALILAIHGWTCQPPAPQLVGPPPPPPPPVLP